MSGAYVAVATRLSDLMAMVDRSPCGAIGYPYPSFPEGCAQFVIDHGLTLLALTGGAQLQAEFEDVDGLRQQIAMMEAAIAAAGLKLVDAGSLEHREWALAPREVPA